MCGAEPIVHEFWEEVYVFSGDFIAVDRNGRHLQCYPPNTYTCRPPGVWHGPFKSESGCLLLEIHYFDPDGSRCTDSSQIGSRAKINRPIVDVRFRRRE